MRADSKCLWPSHYFHSVHSSVPLAEGFVEDCAFLSTRRCGAQNVAPQWSCKVFHCNVNLLTDERANFLSRGRAEEDESPR